jgi:hypothetical protein
LRKRWSLRDCRLGRIAGSTGIRLSFWYALERGPAIVATAVFVYLDARFTGIANLADTFDDRLKQTERQLWFYVLSMRLGIYGFFSGKPPDSEWTEPDRLARDDIEQFDEDQRASRAVPYFRGPRYLLIGWIWWVIGTALMIGGGIAIGLWAARTYPLP